MRPDLSPEIEKDLDIAIDYLKSVGTELSIHQYTAEETAGDRTR